MLKTLKPRASLGGTPFSAERGVAVHVSRCSRRAWGRSDGEERRFSPFAVYAVHLESFMNGLGVEIAEPLRIDQFGSGQKAAIVIPTVLRKKSCEEPNSRWRGQRNDPLALFVGS